MNYPADHPMWRLLQTTSYLLFAAFVMWLNASNFDETELKALFYIGTFMFAGEGVKRAIAKMTKEDKDGSTND